MVALGLPEYPCLTLQALLQVIHPFVKEIAFPFGSLLLVIQG
jgi:hypothetical protein